jgi:ADP-ribose pyrophosphatase YjhB (NUDIX family)
VTSARDRRSDNQPGLESVDDELPEFPLNKSEYDSIYSKVPRLSVEVLLTNDLGAILMTKRAIEPCTQWCVPGGTVYYGETLLEAVRRVGRRELSIEIETAQFLGYVEYRSHYYQGIDSLVALMFRVDRFTGVPTHNVEASASAWFTEIPDDIHEDVDQFLLDHGLLRPRSSPDPSSEG